MPDLSAFPRRAWLAAARKVLATAPDHLLGYPDPRGVPQLRAALADYLARARGVTADPEHIVMCAGFAHGLAGIGRALARRARRPSRWRTYGRQLTATPSRRRACAAAVPVDGMGAGTDRVDGTDAVRRTPAHQFPTGVALHPRRPAGGGATGAAW